MNGRVFTFLAPFWKDGGLTQAFVQALSNPLEQAERALLEGREDAVNPATMPNAWLDFWLYALGLPLTIVARLDEPKRRAVLAVLVDVWHTRTRADGLARYVQALTDEDARVEWAQAAGFIAGVGKAGDVCGLIAPFWSFKVFVPSASTLTDAELRALLEPVAPVFCTYTIERV
jgi:phage tail-like protein